MGSILISLALDGDQWCALLGPNLHEGVAGFGNTQTEALLELAFALETEKQPVESIKTTCDAQLEAKLSEYLQLQEENSKFEKLKKELKPLFEDVPVTIVGKYKVVGARINRKAYPMPACSYWRMSIKPA